MNEAESLFNELYESIKGYINGIIFLDGLQLLRYKENVNVYRFRLSHNRKMLNFDDSTITGALQQAIDYVKSEIVGKEPYYLDMDDLPDEMKEKLLRPYGTWEGKVKVIDNSVWLLDTDSE